MGVARRLKSAGIALGRHAMCAPAAWYEIEPTARGTRYRYAVIFTNEDGGTPADRLMATWGRTTDIEYLYSVEIDRTAAILDAGIQGPEQVLPFKERPDGRSDYWIWRPFAGER
ncbi:MAG: hypothetical protein ABIP65_03835 [Vicinamibacterales bacterium]